jgi:phosphatidylethanolamine-binding protein (PEBP) family uncharacterized protein
MAPAAHTDQTDTRNCSRKSSPTGLRQRVVAWLTRVPMLCLSLLVVHCGTHSNNSSSTAEAAGMATAVTGGVSGSGATASGGTVGNGGAQILGSSGGAAVIGTAGESGVSNSTASGGTVASSGGHGSGGASVGGTTAPGGTFNASGASNTGGISNSGGANSTGGKSSTGGVSNPGGATSTGGSNGGAATGGASSSAFTLTSPGWTNMAGCGPTNKTACAPLPTEITRSGAGTSPELHWTGAPAGTKSFVILLQDLNNGTAHWILWNIPATFTTLAANVDQTTATPATPAGSQQCGKGTDAATTNGYYGPGAACNVYEFMVYALSTATFSPTSDTDQEAVRTQLQALGASILGTASLRGRTNQGC